MNGNRATAYLATVIQWRLERVLPVQEENNARAV
jgi:hypothetical protein